MSKSVFLSYSRQDVAFVTRLADDLNAQGVSPWLDQRDISFGKRWDNTIEQALQDCDIVLVVLSPEAVASENVRDELGYALDLGKHVMPILRRDCAIPMRIRRLEYIDFRLDYTAALPDLLAALHGGFYKIVNTIPVQGF